MDQHEAGKKDGYLAQHHQTCYEEEVKLEEMRKGDLHVHLNGAFPISIVREILAEEKVKIPPKFDIDRDLSHAAACGSLSEYLVPWQVLRLIPKRPENFDRLIDGAMAALSRHRVRFVELRSSVLYLGGLQKVKYAEALQRLIFSTGTAARKHGIRRGIIMTVTRGDYSCVNLAALIQAYKDLGQPRDIVGIDLAGDEEIPYPIELPALFRKAKFDYGLGVTIHAGETGRAENIFAAVELFKADRIGHGTAAGKVPKLMEFLAKKDICLEVCPISNSLTGAVPPDSKHPLKDFKNFGVPFVICSDNPAIHQGGLVDDMKIAINQGMSYQDMKNQYSFAKKYSFITDI